MSVTELLRSYIAQTLKSLAIEVALEQIKLEHPGDLAHGDYSTNIALILAKEQKINPKALAEKIANAMTELPKEVSKVEVAGPGFINIYLSKDFFVATLQEIRETQNYGAGDVLNGKKIIVEYTNTNVLKPLHIGHLMGNVIGESLSRIFGYLGAEVKRNTYQGDVGLHIAKTLWGIQNLAEKFAEVQKADLHAQILFIGEAYAHGAGSYEENPLIADEIKAINKKMFDHSDAELNTLYAWARKVSLDHFEELYKKLGTKFDYYFFESEVEKDAVAIIHKFLEAGIFEKSDGAVVFKAENYNPKLHTRVFINSQGIPTYEAKDIAHAVRKYGVYKADQSIIITANEQDSYFKVVLTALAQTFPEIALKMKHLSHGMLKLTTGKMSSRKGNVITGESLITDMEEAVFVKMAEREMDEKNRGIIATQVGVAAIKYAILRQGLGHDIIFDPEKSLSFEGDSGPYLQYAHTRTVSVLAKAATTNIKGSLDLVEQEISSLEKLLYRFPEVIARAGNEQAPSYLVTYLVELASAFNSYYADHKIVDEKDSHSAYRVALTQAVERVLANGLYLLGIAVPEQM